MRKILISFLIVCGLLRLMFYYVGLPYNKWVLGPLTHTFTFASSLSEAELTVVKKNGEKAILPLKMNVWDTSSDFGFFVRRAKMSSLLGLSRDQNFNPQIINLRKLYWCLPETGWVILKTRRYSSENFQDLFRLDCN